MRRLANHLGFSAAYLSDVEHGHRNPLNYESIKKVSMFLSLSKDEEHQLFDEAARASNAVPSDVLNFLKGRNEIIDLLRVARDHNTSKTVWIQMTKQITK